MPSGRAAVRLAAVVLGLAGAIALACAHRESPLNVVLVSVDTLRADRLGAYGYTARPTSPRIDALATEALLFEVHVAAAPWTTPSHMSLLTGLVPTRHGVTGSDRGLREALKGERPIERLPEAITTLAEALAARGWATAAFTGGATLDPRIGFDQGFGKYDTSMVKLDRAKVDRVLGWIDAHDEGPFFLFWHTFEAHAPYLGTAFLSEVLPEREAERLREAVGRYAARFERKAVGPAWFPKMLKRRRAYTRDVTEALYVGSIADADRWLGILVEDLRGRGLYDRALIVVTSDHGEEFGDRSPEIFYDAHGASLHREMVRVPLVVKLPGQDRGGTRVEALTRGVDVMPTVLDVLSLPGPAEMQGESLRPLWEGREATPRVAYAEALQDRHEQKAIQSSGYKLIVQIDAGTVARQGRAHVPAVLESRWLFDLSSDPNERQDLLAAPRRSGDERRADALEVALRGHVAAQETDTDEVEVHDELLQQLRSLGYVE